MIDITLLGTASLLPLPERAETAVFLACAGRSILFDCGEGTQTAARRAGVSLMKTDLIALTHYHGDHTFGLPGLLQTMSVLGRTEPLWLTGPEGLEKELAPILKLTGHTNYPIQLMSLPSEGLALRDIAAEWPAEASLAAFPTSHRVPSQGYRFTLRRAGRFDSQKARSLNIPVKMWGRLQHGEALELDGRVLRPDDVLGPPRRGLCFVFSGDTTPCDSLTRGAEGADLFLCEGTYGDNEEAELAAEHGHMTFAQAAETAAKAGAKRLWLAHYSQKIRDPGEYLPNATALFPEAVCGEDGMRLTLRFEED